MWRFFSLLALPAYAGIVFYIGTKCLALIQYFQPAFRAYIFWPLHILICISFIAAFFLRFDWLRHTAMLLFPFIVYLFMALLAVDAVKLVMRLIQQHPVSGELSAAGTGIALGITVLLIAYGSHHARDIRTAHYEINLDKSIENPLHVALVSDLHIGSASMTPEHIATIVDTVNNIQPDIVCISGDIFDGGIDSARDLEHKLAELKRLSAPMGVFACPGNHDVDRLSLRETSDGTGSSRIKQLLENAGITLLSDETVLINDSFYLIGRKDMRPIGLDAKRKTAAELTSDLDKSLPLIVMDHQPMDFQAIEEAGGDLILSGHTHRGQFFPGNVMTHLIFKKAGAVNYGHWQGKSSQAIVTSGAGIWGPPVRIGTDSEVALIEIKLK